MCRRVREDGACAAHTAHTPSPMVMVVVRNDDEKKKKVSDVNAERKNERIENGKVRAEMKRKKNEEN